MQGSPFTVMQDVLIVGDLVNQEAVVLDAGGVTGELSAPQLHPSLH